MGWILSLAPAEPIWGAEISRIPPPPSSFSSSWYFWPPAVATTCSTLLQGLLFLSLSTCVYFPPLCLFLFLRWSCSQPFLLYLHVYFSRLFFTFIAVPRGRLFLFTCLNCFFLFFFFFLVVLSQWSSSQPILLTLNVYFSSYLFLSTAFALDFSCFSYGWVVSSISSLTG